MGYVVDAISAAGEGKETCGRSEGKALGARGFTVDAAIGTVSNTAAGYYHITPIIDDYGLCASS